MADETTTPPQPKSQSLALIRERLHGAGTHDFSKAARVHHAALDVMFCVVPMRRTEYEQYRTLRAFEEIRHRDAGHTDTSVPIDRAKSDAFLLQHAVFSEDGEALCEEDAKALMDGAGLWPSTKTLLSAAEKENPPRENLAFEVQLLWRKNQAEIAVWQVLFECGLGKALLDWMAPSATPEEQEKARHNIVKAEEAVNGFAAFFDAKEAARLFGLKLREAAQGESVR
jgi:hypothetical protein